MRLFIAVDIPEQAREMLRRGLGTLRRDLPSARWVRPEGIHITLKFLGEQPADEVVRLDEVVRAALAGLRPVPIELGGGGFFPHERRPRVAWVGGQAPGLERWAAAIEEAAAAAGVPREGRPFSLHLTLARLERPWGERAVEDFLVRVGKWSFPPFEAREAVLFSSDLKPTGAEYAVVRRWAVEG
jgi:2'-5' RNA ligase